MTASVPIWFDDLAVGHVDVASDGSLSLRYAERWLQTTGAFPLSVTMPLRAEPYPSDIISPWLANLLPEEEQLQVLTRSLGLDQADVLAVLAEIGGDTAGAPSAVNAAIRALSSAAATAEGAAYCDLWAYQLGLITAGETTQGSNSWHAIANNQHHNAYGHDTVARAVSATITAQSGWLAAL